MSVIIRLQNLPWSANALDIRNFFRGLSIPEGGVHIVGGELGDAFIAFSTDEDARQGMMLNGGKIKEIQVKLLLSSRSEMHKVIEAARQSVPILALTATPAPPAPPIMPPNPAPPTITPFSAALGTNPLSNFSIPGIGNPQEIPQPAVIEFPPSSGSPTHNATSIEDERDEEKPDRMRRLEKDRRRSRSRTRSRERERKDRKRDRRDRSRSRERRRRDRSRSRDRRERKRDRKDRSRSRERSPPRRPRDKRGERKSPQNVSQERSLDGISETSGPMQSNMFPKLPLLASLQQVPTTQTSLLPNGPLSAANQSDIRFTDPSLADTFNKLQELGKKRNPNAFQGDQNGSRFSSSRGGNTTPRGGTSFRRENRPSRFDDPQRDCCVAIRNAPNHTSYGDVRRFFPFMIDKHGIKMINDSMGRRTGNIFVRFCDNRSKQMALQKKSNELKGADVTVEDLDDDSYESAVDSFLPFREDNDDDDSSLVIAEMEENTQPTYNVIKLSDLPNYVKEHDIIKTFSDFSLLSIVIKDCRTSRSKIAFVHFVKTEDAMHVLEHKENYVFGRRHPIIVGIGKDEFESEKPIPPEKSSFSNDEMEQSRDSPAPRDPRQRRQQIEQGIQPDTKVPIQSVPPPSIPPVVAPMKVAPPIQTQGPPPSFFSNPQFPVQPQFGTPYPSPQFGAFPTRPPVVPQVPPPNTNSWPSRPPFSNQSDQLVGRAITNPHVVSVDMEEEQLDCILMKGLPRGANDRSIVTFLSDTGAVPARIHIMLDATGAPSGECYCEFRSTQEAKQAAAKHGKKLEDCNLTITLVPKRIVEEALEGPKKLEVSKRDGLLGSAPPPVYFAQPRGGYVPRGPYRGRGGFERGGYNRGGFDQSRGGYDHSRGEYAPSRGGYCGRSGWNERGGRGFERGRGRGFVRGRGMARDMYENGRERDAQNDEDDPGLEDFGAPGCVVSMENVPFRATIDDILTFFSEFDLSHDDVIRRYNERGQPTGDARVAFPTAFDAQRAVQTCHMNTIHDRRIHLSVL